MPTIYRILCTACGKSPEVNGGVAGYVTTDDGKEGKILPEGYLALKLDTGEFVCLAHPIEDSILKRHGFNWIQASSQGRLFRVTFKICKQCGSFYEEHQMHDSRSGCMVGLIGAMVAIPALTFIAKFSWSLSFLSAYFVMLGVFGLVAVINWLRWRKPNTALKLRNCRRCQATDFMTLSKAAGTAFPCPRCGAANVRITMAGIS